MHYWGIFALYCKYLFNVLHYLALKYIHQGLWLYKVYILEKNLVRLSLPELGTFLLQYLYCNDISLLKKTVVNVTVNSLVSISL